MKNLIKTIKKVSLLILAISFIGCDDDDSSLPQLTAGLRIQLMQIQEQ